MLRDGPTSRRRSAHAVGGRVVPKPLDLHAPVANERAQDEGVGDGGGGEDLEGGEERAELLAAAMVDDGRDAIGGDAHEDEGQREEKDEGDFPGIAD